MADDDFAWTVKACDDLNAFDLKLVSEFFNEHFPGVFYPKCFPEIFTWKLGDGNPAGRGFLTVAMYKNQVVGTTSGTRRELIFRGERVPGMEIGDTFTHPDFRRSGHCATPYQQDADPDGYFSRSIFGRLVMETLDRARKAGVVHVYGTPNENSRPPYIKRLGFQEIGSGKIQTWSSISPKTAFQGRFASLLSLFSKGAKLLQALGVMFGKNGYSIKIVPFEAIEELMANMVEFEFPDQNPKADFVLSRGLNFLRDRYQNHPTYSYYFYLVARREKPIGIVIANSLTRSSGRRTLVISDWFGERVNMRKQLPLVIALILRNFPNVEIASVWSENEWTKAMTWYRFGFIGRKNVSLIYKCLSQGHNPTSPSFSKFRFGWSDNG